MQCPSCGASIPEGSTRCEFCNRVIEQPGAVRPLSARPEKYHVEDDAGGLRIWWRWFSPAVFFLLPFAIAWNAFLVGWYGMATQMPGMPGGMRIIFFVFPMAHVAVGVGLAYAVLTMLLNRSQVTVDRGVLTVSHGPLPWPGATINTDDIEQIFCSESRAKNKQGTLTFTIQARLKDGGVKTLLSNVSSSSEVLYLEQALEQHLRIRDAPVTGELPR